MAFLREFRDFAVKGNAVDLAVGVIIGAAFGKIVSSLVDNVVMPSIGLLIGGVDFTRLMFTVDRGIGGKGATIKYGIFVQNVFDFLIVAMAIFVAVKTLNRFKSKPEAAAGPPPRTEILLQEIRDLLKAGGSPPRS
jgi:large conductance mechanosensitive channel